MSTNAHLKMATVAQDLTTALKLPHQQEGCEQASLDTSTEQSTPLFKTNTQP
jgi:hypothetical protein